MIGTLTNTRGPFPGEDGWGRENWKVHTYEATYSCGHVLVVGTDDPSASCLVCTGAWPKSAAVGYKDVSRYRYSIQFTRAELKELIGIVDGTPFTDRVRGVLNRADEDHAMWGEGY